MSTSVCSLFGHGLCPKYLKPQIPPKRGAKTEPSRGGEVPRARRTPSRLQTPVSPIAVPDLGVALRTLPQTVPGRLAVSSNKEVRSPNRARPPGRHDSTSRKRVPRPANCRPAPGACAPASNGRHARGRTNRPAPPCLAPPPLLPSIPCVSPRPLARRPDVPEPGPRAPDLTLT